MTLPSLEEVEYFSEPEARTLWSRLYRKPPPAWPVELLRLGIAHELQRRNEGGLSRVLRARLRHRSEHQAAEARPRYRPGTALVREWHGRTHSVAVADGAFLYEGRSYSSLSAIAREITGTRWSGPRFFGVSGA
jgi:hypothetical protein